MRHLSVIHKGTITKVTDKGVTVRISPNEEECSGCAIGALCSKGEEVEIACDSPSPSLLGKAVTIGATSTAQRSGIILFFIMPLILLIGIMLVCAAVRLSEALSACVAFGGVALWYLILYLFRAKVREKARFVIIE